ncbi:hypothetical protein FB639_005052, partial [Coemansia asiatica]
FVHHTVIHNRGGFKSLAEGELVEFDVTRGPKGLQATKVTGPSGTFVRGDPYFRLRPKIVSASIGGESSSVSVAASPYFTYSHYPPMAHHPAGYSQLIPFNSQMPQPHYGAYAYSATQPTNAPFVIPPPLPANTAIRPDAHAHIALSPQYFSVSYPAQTQAHQGRGSALGQSSSQQQLSAITIPYDSFFVNQPQRQQQNHTAVRFVLKFCASTARLYDAVYHYPARIFAPNSHFPTLSSIPRIYPFRIHQPPRLWLIIGAASQHSHDYQ